ncbi:MFS transporter [Streptomyces sp. enrichment culture]|uniref:MFS transporter n=1 Tax=Streptomyces sp. enrichment culture TaxID=1795815 RepID=UPI003F561E5F
MPLPVFAMMACTFCIGTAESVIAGILPSIAREVGVSLPAVGLLISAYALAVVLAGPLVTAATAGLRRAVLMPALMLVFVVGNVQAALAPGFGWLMSGRVVSAVVHSTLIAVFVATARDMAPPEHRAAWGAKVTLGIGLSSVAGVPVGTLVGEAFGWRATFWSLAGLSLAATVLLTRCTVPEAVPLTVPRRPEAPGADRRRAPALPGPVLLVALVITLGTGGVFALYTYASPYLTQAVGLDPRAVTVLLLLYGAGGVVGNSLGGRAADRFPHAAVPVTLGTATAGLLLLALPPGNGWVVAALFCLLGAAYFAGIPALNTRIVAAAGPSSPTMALTVNNSAFCVGIALGSWLGGLLLSHGHGLPSVAAAGAALTATAWGLSLARPGHGAGRRTTRVTAVGTTAGLPDPFPAGGDRPRTTGRREHEVHTRTPPPT